MPRYRLGVPGHLTSRVASGSATAGGIVAAGHPQVADVAAAVLRDGGNAVDAAVAGLLASWACEPLLTGPAGGGYLLVAGAGHEPTVLDGFCAAPGLGGEAASAELVAADCDFGDTRQVFHVGAASVASFAMASMIEAAAARWGSLPLADLAEPGARLAERGVALNDMQAYVARILEPILTLTPGIRAQWIRDGAPLGEGDAYLAPGLADTIRRIGKDGAAPLRTGDLAAACVELVQRGGGALTMRDLAEHEPTAAAPLRVGYRGRTVLTAPPSSAGGALLAVALQALERTPSPPGYAAMLEAMETAQLVRTPAFARMLTDDGFAGTLLDLARRGEAEALEELLGRQPGSTTHLSVLDSDGMACAITTSLGEGCGLMVPETGIHLNNVMGEEDLNPLGFGVFPPGRRMPSMMCPAAVLTADGTLELALGSAGSNRIRSALLRTIVARIDEGLPLDQAVEAPRLHREGATVYAEPGVDTDELFAPRQRGMGTPESLVAFRERNLFFGGAQAVGIDPITGEHVAAGDSRRGGAIAVA